MTTNFPAMGDHPLEGNIVNISGQPSKYTMEVPRKGPSSDVLAQGGTAHRGAISMSGEHNGPTFRPVAKLPFTPDPSTGRGMRTVRSSMGNRDFWDQRASSTGQVI